MAGAMHVLVMTPITPSTSAVSCVGGGSARDEVEDDEESEEKEPVRLLPMPVKGKPQSKSPPLTMPTPPPPTPTPPAGPPQGARGFPPPSVVPTRLQAGLPVACDEAPSIHGPSLLLLLMLEPQHAVDARPRRDHA